MCCFGRQWKDVKIDFSNGCATLEVDWNPLSRQISRDSWTLIQSLVHPKYLAYLYIPQSLERTLLKWVSCVVCELYFNNTVTKAKNVPSCELGSIFSESGLFPQPQENISIDMCQLRILSQALKRWTGITSWYDMKNSFPYLCSLPNKNTEELKECHTRHTELSQRLAVRRKSVSNTDLAGV